MLFLGFGSGINVQAEYLRKQREVKAVKTIKDAVIELGGKWPENVCLLALHDRVNIMKIMIEAICVDHVYPNGFRRLCSKAEFESEAKRLGYINGYRWGVEYPTNGKRPDLADDVLVEFKNKHGYWHPDGDCKVVEWIWHDYSQAFRITDPRYKPADTSYLNALSSARPASSFGVHLTHSEEGLTHKPADEASGITESINKAEYVSELRDNKPFDRKVSGFVKAAANKIVGDIMKKKPAGMSDNNWHDRGELPPVGAQVAVTLDKRDRSAEVCGVFCEYVWVRYEDESMPDTVHKMYIRKIRTEREKVIEAVMSFCLGKDSVEEMIHSMYDAGMLVLPPKKSDTED